MTLMVLILVLYTSKHEIKHLMSLRSVQWLQMTTLLFLPILVGMYGLAYTLYHPKGYIYRNLNTCISHFSTILYWGKYIPDQTQLNHILIKKMVEKDRHQFWFSLLVSISLVDGDWSEPIIPFLCFQLNGATTKRPINSYSASHSNWCTGTLVNRTITIQWEGMGDVGSARYEPAVLPPCPTIRALSYSNCHRSTHSTSKWIFRNLAL